MVAVIEFAIYGPGNSVEKTDDIYNWGGKGFPHIER